MIVRELSDLTWLPILGGGRKSLHIIILLYLHLYGDVIVIFYNILLYDVRCPNTYYIIKWVFECLMSVHLVWFMECWGLLPTTQFAYRNGLDTWGAHTHFTLIPHHSMLSLIQPAYPQPLLNPFILPKHLHSHHKHMILLFVIPPQSHTPHLNTQDGYQRTTQRGTTTNDRIFLWEVMHNVQQQLNNMM